MAIRSADIAEQRPVAALTALPEEGTEGVSLRDLTELLGAGKWLILSLGLVGLIVGWTVGFLTPPSYEAEGLVQVEDLSSGGASSALQQLDQLLSVGPVKTVAELQILQSRMVLGDVVKQLNLEMVAVPRYFPMVGDALARHHGSGSLARPLLGLKKYAWGGEEIQLEDLTVAPAYIGQPFVLVAKNERDYSLWDASGHAVLNGSVGQAASSPDGSVRLTVKSLRARSGTEFYVLRLATQVAVHSLANALAITEPDAGSGVFKVVFDGATPAFVAQVVNAIETAYLDQNIQRRSADAQRSLDFLEGQIPEIKSKADAAQTRLMSYQKEHGTVDITSETKSVLDQSVALESQRLQLQQQREQALERFTPDHPAVKALDSELATIDRQRASVAQQMSQLPATQQDVASLMRDVEVNNDLYTTVLNTYEGLEVARAGTIGNVRIIDSALPPLFPVKPKRSVITMVAAFVGVLLGLGIVLMRRALLRGVDDPMELETRLGLTTYALVPYSPEQKELTLRMGRGSADAVILAEVNSKNVAIEALRSLRTSLNFSLLDAERKVVMLTGPTPAVGKSFVSINLAVVLALSGKSTVVLDADLRRGTLHRYVHAEPVPGVSDFVAGTASIEDILRPSRTANMQIITRGDAPPNPAELLLHDRFTALIETLSARYDFVLIDAPPVLPIADAQIVGRCVGSALIVLKSGEHPLREVQEVYKRLSLANVPVRGVIFNQVGKVAGSYGYGGYGYSYHRYYQYGE